MQLEFAYLELAAEAAEAPPVPLPDLPAGPSAPAGLCSRVPASRKSDEFVRLNDHYPRSINKRISIQSCGLEIRMIARN